MSCRRTGRHRVQNLTKYEDTGSSQSLKRQEGVPGRRRHGVKNQSVKRQEGVSCRHRHEVQNQSVKKKEKKGRSVISL